MGLRPKQLLFVKEYLIDKNATRAAKAAGYSAKTAYAMGSENLSKPEIAAAIREGFEAQIKVSEAKAAKSGLTKERWLQELRLIAFANMDDFVTVDEESRIEDRGENEEPLEFKIQKINLTPTKDRKPGRGRVIKKITETQTQHGGSMGIELHSKLPALELLGKAYGWVKEQVEHSGEVNGNSPQVIITLPSNGRETKNE